MRTEMVDEILFLKSNIDLFGASNNDKNKESEDYVDVIDKPDDEEVGLIACDSDEN